MPLQVNHECLFSNTYSLLFELAFRETKGNVVKDGSVVLLKLFFAAL